MNNPVFTLTVMDDGDVLIDNMLPAFPISDLVRLLRQIADGFERGDARRVEAPVSAPQVYDRSVLLDVLVYHWRTRTSGCGCGWGVLGASYSEHVADVYEASIAARAGSSWPVEP